MTDGPIFALRARIRAGELEFDPAQELAAEKLQSLHNALAGYRPADAGSWTARFGLGRSAPPPPQGLYLFGDVGRGKSMLMDLFFATAPVARKRRVHFHEFMLELHQTLHAWRSEGAAGRGTGDLLMAFAAKVADEAWLLCFDEFHVANIADAMLLGRLFEGLFARGAVIVATSNWPPDELYKDGLQRESFVPFIALIKDRLDLLEIASPVDYRLSRLAGRPVYHHPLGPAAAAALDDAWARLTDDAEGRPETVAVQGRELAVPRVARGVAWFDFDALCGGALGAADYLAIAGRYRAIVLAGVPAMAPAQRNEARRFAILIDALYENRVTLVCSAAAAPAALYPKGTGAKDFRRTVSRLMEMQSAAYVGGG